MKKKVLVIVAVIALVAILGICLVACNAESYTKKLKDEGYEAGAVELNDGQSDTIEWIVSGTRVKTLDSVTITKFKNTDDAKDAEAAGNKLGEGRCYRTGKIVIVGTVQGVKDAK